MAHVPRAICAECLIEMRPTKNGVEIEMLHEDGTPYYKMQGDEYGCQRCLKKVLVGFGTPYVFSHQEDKYDNFKVDVQAEFA